MNAIIIAFSVQSGSGIETGGGGVLQDTVAYYVGVYENSYSF